MIVLHFNIEYHKIINYGYNDFIIKSINYELG